MRGKRKWLSIAAALVAALVIFLVWLTYEPKYQGRPLGDLVAELTSTDDRVQMLATQAVAEMGPEAIPYLERNIAVTGLGRYPQLTLGITEMSRHLPLSIGNAIRRRWGIDREYYAGSSAAIALADMGEDAKPAIPALLAALKHKDPNIRSQAADAILRIAPDDPEVLAALFDAVSKDPEDWIFSNLSNVFPLLHPQNQAVVLHLRQAFSNTNSYIRFNSVRALGGYQPPQAETLQLLRSVLLSTNLSDQVGAAVSLAELGHTSDEVVQVLILAVEGKEVSDLLAAATELSKSGIRSDQSIPAVEKLLQHPLPWVQVAAINFFLDQGRAVDSLPSLLAGKFTRAYSPRDMAARLDAYAKVKQIHPDDFSEVKSIAGFLRSNDNRLRQAALKALARLGPAAFTHLGGIESSMADESMGVHFEAAKTLATLQPDNAKLHVALKQWLTEDGYASRLEAVKLIQDHPEFVERYRKQLQALTKAKGERLRKAASEALAPLKEGVKQP